MSDPIPAKIWAMRARETRAAILSGELKSDTDLYSCLRTRILRNDRVPTFTMGQIWALDSLCVEATASYDVVVYLFYGSVENMNAGWERVRDSLAVNATAHYAGPGSDGNLYIALLFTMVSPLVGPMTFAEAQRAVQHYLGWCSNQAGDKPLGSSFGSDFITVELVEQSDLREWLDCRESAIAACQKKEFFLGSGMRCPMPCEPTPLEMSDSKVATRGQRELDTEL